MTVTIGSFTTNALLAQPFGYEGDARTGLTARTFRINGLLTSSQWQALISEYNTWRNTRLTDADTLYSGTVGTTVSLTISSTNGLSATNLACWFTEPPSGEQAGIYVSATVTLVDAAQALAVLLRQKEKERQSGEALVASFGTVALTWPSNNTVTIVLTKPMETRQDGPTSQLTALGKTYISGPFAAHKLRQIEGYIQETNKSATDVLAWYDYSISGAPVVDSWFPISAPTFNAEVIISGGVKTTRWTVQLSAIQVK